MRRGAPGLDFPSREALVEMIAQKSRGVRQGGCIMRGRGNVRSNDSWGWGGQRRT